MSLCAERVAAWRNSSRKLVNAPASAVYRSILSHVLDALSLQRHFRVLTKFAHVESQLSGRKRQREAVFYAPVNLCDRRLCSTSVAVGLYVRGDQRSSS